MVFEFSPVVIAAIVTASVAVISILAAIIHHCVRQRSGTVPSSKRHTLRNVFGLPSPASTNVVHKDGIVTTPSTGHTALVTPPHPDKGKKSNKARGFTSPIRFRPDSTEELIVVTYEEGLARMGLSTSNSGSPGSMGILPSGQAVLAYDTPRSVESYPYSVSYPTINDVDPPGFDEARQAYPVVSPRKPSGRSYSSNAEEGIRDEVPSSVSTARLSYMARPLIERLKSNDIPLSFPTPIPTSTPTGTTTLLRTPSTGGSTPSNVLLNDIPPALRPGSLAVGRDVSLKGRVAQSTWLPSYYHSTSNSGLGHAWEEARGSSQLDYRTTTRLSSSPGSTMSSGQGGVSRKDRFGHRI